MSDGQSDIDYGAEEHEVPSVPDISASVAKTLAEREHITRTNRLIDLARKTTDSIAENIEQITEYDLVLIESKVRLYMATVWNVLERKQITNLNGNNHG